MRLLIISNMAHYRRNGEIVGWGPTVQEIDHLAELFEEVIHVACLHSDGSSIQSALPYSAPNVRFRPIPPAGGTTLWEKARILALYPLYAGVILDELRRAEAVHVRCPANVSLLAILLLSFLRRPEKRWIKYAGSWQSYEGESWTYAVQRWWLERGLTKAEVSVNGSWQNQPLHVHSFMNPCLTDEELVAGRRIGRSKEFGAPFRLLFVGKIVETKGIFRVLEIVKLLHERGMHLHLDVVGDGPDRHEVERRLAQEHLSACVTMHGWIPRTEMGPRYASSHFLLLPSRSEGWPKVISEAMAYGTVPVAGAVGSIPQQLRALQVGRVLPYQDVTAFADAVTWYSEHPGAWKSESERGVQKAGGFSYTRYARAVRDLFERAGRVVNEIHNEAAPSSSGIPK